MKNIMRKVLAAIMILAMVIPFASCTKKEHILHATVVGIDGTDVTVEPIDDNNGMYDSDRISFSAKNLPYGTWVQVGTVVDVTHVGNVRKGDPATIEATAISISSDLRHLKYTDEWIDKESYYTNTNCPYLADTALQITKIYSDCFFLLTNYPVYANIKLNGELPDEWCVGDRVKCTYKNAYWNTYTNRIEADLVSIRADDTPEVVQNMPVAPAKPVIYLYPEEKTDVSVKLDLDGAITCTYPAYRDGWYVTAEPDGTLTDGNGQTYSYLYWEGETDIDFDISKGFCVKGEDTAAFLEDALEKLGLNRREANEFIVYWLPLMQNNKYNIISFPNEAYCAAAKMDISPAPDTVIRVFMTYKASDEYVETEPIKLTAPERKGFTVVEWGGSSVK